MAGKSNGKITRRKVIIGILAVIVAASSAVTVKQYLERKHAEDLYASLASQVETTEAPTTEQVQESESETEEYISPIDFSTLLEKNPDTIGWITIPDTKINYPIVQAADNDKYLHRDFEGNDSVYGTIYLDMDSDADMMGRNNILYGHNMKDGSMFKDVVRYKEETYFKEHQFFEIYTPERTIHLKAVSCYYGEAKPIIRKTKFKTRESFDAFIQEMLKSCKYAEIPDVEIESLYTLITCSYEINDARTFLFAVEVDEEGNVIEAEDPEAGFSSLESAAEAAGKNAESAVETTESAKTGSAQ